MKLKITPTGLALVRSPAFPARFTELVAKLMKDGKDLECAARVTSLYTAMWLCSDDNFTVSLADPELPKFVERNWDYIQDLISEITKPIVACLIARRS
jgi:hypothetical protein